jgi:pimeloyl-ACP methyl ester carboxylesterase
MTRETVHEPAPKAPQAQRSSLPEALDAPRTDFETDRSGRVSYYSDTSAEGRPLLLVHSVNAAPSSYEVKPLFDHFRGTRPVYSMDLPGFGHSDRSTRRYSPELFADAIADFLKRVVLEPADVVALSLGAEFAARATLADPARVTSLALISPTGFGKRPAPDPRLARIAHKALALPGLSQATFELASSRRSIRYYLGKSFVGEPDAGMLDYAYATSHQPGAANAPLYFLSSQLFTRDAVSHLYGKLPKLPVLVIADRDPYVTFEHLDQFVAQHDNWRLETLGPHLGLPHWERREATLELLSAFWEGASS